MRLRLIAGRGGKGAASFEVGKRGELKGRPDGGNGGRGGDVYVVADAMHADFGHLGGFPKKAENGSSGRRGHCTGAIGTNLVLPVPIGTTLACRRIVGDSCVAETTHDLMDGGQRILVAKGGAGGRGNYSINRNNGDFEPGFEGDVVECSFSLKLMADIGLVGLPNAGKSSFLACISAARPKIAYYPFTTLNPSLGTIERPLPCGSLEERSDSLICEEKKHWVIADIPGLIEGAHRNVGLGHDFLKHIEKSNVLGYVIDITAKDPFQDLLILRNELLMHDYAAFVKKPFFILANKMDVKDLFEKNIKIFREKLSNHPELREITVVSISAKNHTNIEAAAKFINDLLLSVYSSSRK